MAASSHDGMASGIYQKPDISKQMTFQDSALLSGLQKIDKKLKSLDNDLHALRADKNENPRKNINHQEDKSLETETGLDTILEIVLEIHKTDIEGYQDGHTWKHCWEMQVNAKKARRLKEIDYRDNDPSDTFNSMMSEDPISDEDHDGLIRNFSEMAELI